MSKVTKKKLKNAKSKVKKDETNIFDEQFPNIARWVIEQGYIEVGYDEFTSSFIKAIDMGGGIWSGKSKYNNVHEALLALDKALKKHMKERFGE